MTSNEFKEAYSKAKVWADLDAPVDGLSHEQKTNLVTALSLVKEFTGLDMRQDFLLGVLKSVLKYG